MNESTATDLEALRRGFSRTKKIERKIEEREIEKNKEIAVGG